MASIHIKHIILLMSLNNLERAVVRALQWFAVSVMSDIHIASGGKIARCVGRTAAVELLCRGKDGAHIVSELAEKLGGHLQLPWLMRKEFPRDADGSAIHEIRGGAVRVFPPGCPNAEEYEREFIHPAWALEASLERSLQLSVKTLHKTVGLRAVSCRVGG